MRKFLPAALIFFSCLLLFTSLLFAKQNRSEPLLYGAKLCENSSLFECYNVLKGDTWENLWPDAYRREIIMKINRMNIALARGMKIAVPRDLGWIYKTYMDFSPFPLKISNDYREKVVLIDLGKLAWGAYDAEGNLLSWGPISGGKGYCEDVKRRCYTPLGKHRVIQKFGPEHKSSKYPLPKGGAPMPWFIKIIKTGIGPHGSPSVPGFNASHGCIRMFDQDAFWLNTQFVIDPTEIKGAKGTLFVVY